MNVIEIDRLSRETQHQSQTIYKLQNQIQLLQNDIRTQKELIYRTESEKQQLRIQIETLKRKNEQQQYQRQDIDRRYLQVLKKLQDQVEEGKKKFNKLNNKISPLVDYDSVRLSVMAELSQQFQLQVQKFKRTIESQKDQILKLKREKTLLQHKIESMKIDHEEKIRQLNNSIKNESSQNQLTILSLEMSKEIENRLKISYETIRKEAEYYKQKYFSTEKKYQQKVLALQRELKIQKSRPVQY